MLKVKTEMTDPVLKSVIVTPDGQQFETKAEAMNHLRRPKILEAMMTVTDKQKELSDWLTDNQEAVVSAFDSGTIRRITKAEQKKIDKALDAMAESGDKVYDIFVKNRDEFVVKYRPQPRMKDDEKKLAAKNTLMAASDNNEDLSNWVMEHETEILEAYDAGKEKRAVSPKATAGLDAYRAGKKEEKRLIEEEKMDPAKAREAGEKLTAKLKAEALANLS
jgi:hypothetical protein